MRGSSRGRTTVTRRSVLATAGAGGLGALPGCGGNRVWGSTADGTVTLEYVEVAGTRTRETFDPVVAALNEGRDETIELQFEEIPYENMRSQLQTRVGGGDPPDVAAIDQIWLGTFADGDALLSLDSVADDTDVEDFLDPFVRAARFDGSLYAFPTTTDVRGMYWNKEAFADAGLDPESPPETWEELFEVAAALHDPPNRYGAALFTNAGRWTVPLFAAGGRVLDESGTEPRFHEPPGVAAAEFVDVLYNDHEVSAPEPTYQDGAQLAREFLQGQYALTIVEGSWLDYFWENLGNERGAMVEQFGFAPTPRPADGETATMSGGHMWAAFADAEHPDLARDFIREATRREFMRHLSIEAGQIPTRESLWDDDAVWEEILYGDVVRDLLSETRLRPVRNWSVVAEWLDPALQRIAHDEADPEEALEAARREVQSALND